ncbi:MAG TPA: ATP-binding cassette domain-containing protein [Lachnospiraceae bacterium]|nr:ATP-binding cassette domain-containing protein [Lachnospiraceae bacterium]
MKLSLVNVSKSYGDNTALDGFCFEFTSGVYGLLGPNGAGKSTLMNLITDNLEAQEGSILYNEVSIQKLGAKYRSKIGFMPQQQTIYPFFSLERFLWYMAALKGMKKEETREDIARLLRLVNLSDCATKQLGSFSGGMKQRALLAQALLGNPEVIILDEPTAGLDPKERIRIRNLISKVAFDKIIIIATHVVSDIEFIAKEVLLMEKGKIIDNGSPGELCKEIEGKVFEITTDEESYTEVSNHYRVGNIVKEGNQIIMKILSDREPSEYTWKSQKPDLEDLYLYYFE